MRQIFPFNVIKCPAKKNININVKSQGISVGQNRERDREFYLQPLHSWLCWRWEKEEEREMKRGREADSCFKIENSSENTHTYTNTHTRIQTHFTHCHKLLNEKLSGYCQRMVKGVGLLYSHYCHTASFYTYSKQMWHEHTYKLRNRVGKYVRSLQ